MIIENGSTPVVVFKLVEDSAPHSEHTGQSPTVTISKNGGAFAAITGSVTEIANGFYKFSLTATETDTDGPLIVRATNSGSLDWDDIHEVATSLPADVVSHTATHPDVAITSSGLDEIVTALMTADLEAETTAYLAGSGTGPKAAKTFLGIAHKLNGAVQGGSVITVYAFDGVTPLWTHSIVTDTDVETVTSQGAPA